MATSIREAFERWKTKARKDVGAAGVLALAVLYSRLRRIYPYAAVLDEWLCAFAECNAHPGDKEAESRFLRATVRMASYNPDADRAEFSGNVVEFDPPAS